MKRPESNSRSPQEHLDRIFHLLAGFVLKNTIWEGWRGVSIPGQQPAMAKRKLGAVMLTPEHPLTFSAKNGPETTEGSGQYTVQAMYRLLQDGRKGQPDLHIGVQLGEQLAQVPDIRRWPHVGPNKWEKVWNPPLLGPPMHYGFDYERHATQDDQPRLLQITRAPLNAAEPSQVGILYHRPAQPNLDQPQCAEAIALVAERVETALQHSIRPIA